MKRVISMILCLMLVFSLAISASAADGYTITIKNNDLDSADDHVYKAYQIFGGVLDSSGTILTEITWGESLSDPAAFLAALKAESGLEDNNGTNIFASATDAASVSEILAKSEHHTHTILSAFAKVASDHVQDDPVAQSNGMTEQDGKGYYYITIDES